MNYIACPECNATFTNINPYAPDVECPVCKCVFTNIGAAPRDSTMDYHRGWHDGHSTARKAAEVVTPWDADGEAFRTAANLGLTLRFYGGCAQSSMPGSPCAYEVVSGSDRAASMREAVRRASDVIARGGEALDAASTPDCEGCPQNDACCVPPADPEEGMKSSAWFTDSAKPAVELAQVESVIDDRRASWANASQRDREIACLALDDFRSKLMFTLRRSTDSAKPAGEPCPTCGAPCTTEVLMRGGDHGWGTTDKERTVYRYAAAPTPAADSEKVPKVLTGSEGRAYVRCEFCHQLTSAPDSQGAPKPVAWPGAAVATSWCRDFPALAADLINHLQHKLASDGAREQPPVDGAQAAGQDLDGLLGAIEFIVDEWRENGCANADGVLDRIADSIDSARSSGKGEKAS